MEQAASAPPAGGGGVVAQREHAGGDDAKDDQAAQFRSRQERLQALLSCAEFAVHRLDVRTLAHTLVYCRLNEPRCRAAGTQTSRAARGVAAGPPIEVAMTQPVGGDPEQKSPF